MIKPLKYPKLSALALALGFGVLFMLFSFAEDRSASPENSNTTIVVTNPLDADYQPNEMHIYALWHEIHF